MLYFGQDSQSAEVKDKTSIVNLDGWLQAFLYINTESLYGFQRVCNDTNVFICVFSISACVLLKKETLLESKMMSPSPLDILPKWKVPTSLASDMKCGKRTKKKWRCFWDPWTLKTNIEFFPTGTLGRGGTL